MSERRTDSDQPQAAPKEWLPADLDRLRKMWDAGHSAAKIGEMMRRSKNGIVGKAHRLGLTPRPSPIKRDASMPDWRSAPRKRRAIVLPALDSEQRVAIAVLHAMPVAADEPVQRLLARHMVSAAQSPHKRCQWLCGPDTGCYGRHLPFCEAVTVKGSSYCQQHYKAAHNANAWQGAALRVGTLGAW